jgi:hypothetical protein
MARQVISLRVNKAALDAEVARTGKSRYLLLAEELCAGIAEVDAAGESAGMTEQANVGDVLEIRPAEV